MLSYFFVALSILICLMHIPYDTIEQLDIEAIKRVGRMIAEFILHSGAEMYGR